MPSERSDGITQTSRSHGKRRSATAGCFRVRIADDELRTLQTFRIVDFRTDQILIAHRIDQKTKPFSQFQNRRRFDFVKSKSVLETRTAAAVDKTRNFKSGLFSSAIKSATLAQQLSVKIIGLSSDIVLFLNIIFSAFSLNPFKGKQGFAFEKELSQ